jgi:hypothetical protein
VISQNNNPVVALVILLVLTGILLCRLVLRHYQNRQKSKSTAKWAKAHNLFHEPHRDEKIDHQLREFTCLCGGSPGYAANRVLGRHREWNFQAFYYHRCKYRMRDEPTDTSSAVLIYSTCPLEHLLIIPRVYTHFQDDLFGSKSLNFESHAFSEKYYVRAENRKWAYDVLHPRAIDFLMSRPPCVIEFGRFSVIAYRTGVWEPDTWLTDADTLIGLLEMLPDYVTRQ